MSTLKWRVFSAFLFGSVLCALALPACSFKSKKEPANTIHIPVRAKVRGLDPIYAGDLYAGTEVGRVYEGLLQYHYLKRPYVLIPNLAESMPEVSGGASGKSGQTYTFHLKKGVLFQDDPCFRDTGGKGREFTADDVVYSFKRLADPKLVSTGWWIFDGKILGLNEWRDSASKAGAADYKKVIEGLKAIDRYTVQIKLIQPSAQFIFTLAMPFASIVPVEAVEHYGKEFLNHPVGTGPFRLSESIPGSKFVWTKNPTYRKELYPSDGTPGETDAGKPLPLADRLVAQVFEESQPMWLAFLSQKLDFTGIPKDNYQAAITPGKDLSSDLKEKGIRLVKQPDLDVTYTAFNMKDPLLGKNKLLRQALSLAYDQDRDIDIFYNGRAIPAQGPIPPGLSGYRVDYKNPYRQFNVSKARELLAKAGYPEGKGLPPLDYASTADSTARQSTEYLTQMLSAIGVKLKVHTYSWPEFQSTIKNRKAQMWSMAWSADYPDAENFLQLFYSKNADFGSNDSGYANPQFDRLYEKTLTLRESPERTALYEQMVSLLTEDCPWIFHVHRLKYNLTQPWLKNFKIHDFDHGAAKYYRVEKK